MSLKTSWINFIYNTSRKTKKVRNLLTPLGVVIFGTFTFLFVLASIYVDKKLNLPSLNLEAWNKYISIPFLVFGFVCVFWSVLHFLKVKGTPVPINPPPKLVNTGPYAYTRNPMLTGIFFILYGIGFLIGSFSLIFVFTPLFVLANYWELKVIEEPELLKRLGEQYKSYLEKTPMFFPRINQFF